MKSPVFVLALFSWLVTVSGFTAFAQTYEVRVFGDPPIATPGDVKTHALVTDANVRLGVVNAQDVRLSGETETSFRSANAVNSLSVTNPEKSANIWKWSVASLIAANSLDAASSYGLREGNPLLGTRFNGTSLAIKSGLTAGQIVAQYFVLKRHPEKRRLAAIVNFAVAGGLGVVAAHNFGIRSGR